MSELSKNQKIIDGVVVLSEFDVDTLQNPPADKTFLYAEDDGSGNTILKMKDSAGVEKVIVRNGDSPTFTAVNIDINAQPVDQEGQIRWNNVDKCIEIVQDRSMVLQVGQEVTIRARNVTNQTLPNGTVVYVNGATSQRPRIEKANASALLTAETVIGLVADETGIDHNSDGHVTTFGILHNLNTNDYEEGTMLYLSDSSAGTFTNVKPTSPSSFVVRVGYVVHSHSSQGKILVSISYEGSVSGDNMTTSITSSIPTTATSTGKVGQIAWNTSHVYICVAENTWRRASISTW